jgi:hypothetical protein
MTIAKEANAGRVLLATIIEKEVSFDLTPVTISQREHATALAKCIMPNRIVAGLNRNDFSFAIAALE